MTTATNFDPKPMKLSVLTAALQELTPRERRDPDPDLAVEDWLAFAREIGSPFIQLSAALHPSVSDVPAEAMLDPVANTLDLRAPFDKARAARVRRAMEATGVGLSDLAYFDNMLVADRTARRSKHVATWPKGSQSVAASRRMSQTSMPPPHPEPRPQSRSSSPWFS